MWRLDRRGPVQSWRAIRHAHSQAKIPTMFCQRSDQVINLHRAHAVSLMKLMRPSVLSSLTQSGLLRSIASESAAPS
jgi:hypothetical protein